jgi:serpin B
VSTEAPMYDAAHSIEGLAKALYGKLTEPNLFYSPTSLAVALTMTYAGAHGETARQMAKVLQIPDGARPEDSFGPLVASLVPDDPAAELRIANRLYGQRGFAFDPAFVRLTRDAYKAPLETLDFTSGDQSKAINDWVSEQTQAKINDLIPAGALTTLTRLVLVNAIYFKGAWKTPFSSRATKMEPFFGRGGTKDAPLMHQRVEARYVERSDAQVLELPYASGTLVMDVILPNAPDGLATVDRAIATDGFGAVTRSLSMREVEVTLPRFKITDTLEASSVLGELGMPLAFSEDGADFGAMTKEDALHIDKVFHKAFVDVSELGTEAAAASAVVMLGRGGPVAAPLPIEFRADRPFVFFIWHTRSNAILFVGRLSDV